MTAAMSDGRLPSSGWTEPLRRLAASCGALPRASWEEVQGYTAEFQQGLISHDLGDSAITGGLIVDQVDLIRDGHWSDDVRDAITRGGGHIPNGAVHYFSAHQLMGWTNMLSGTVFEQTVADLANHGQIALPNGADHVVLAGRTQEGWDLALLRGRQVVGHAQVKFSSDAHTIVQHLHNHPDVTIVIANHDAAVAAAHHGIHVIDAGVAYDHLHNQVASEVAHHLGAAHLVHEWVPEVAAIVILAGAARKLQKGERAAAVATWTKEELTKAGLANAVGTAVSLTPHGLILRLPAAMYTRFAMNRFDVARSSGSRTDTILEHLGLVRSEAEHQVPAYG